MIRATLAAFVLTLLASSARADDQQFNLVCAGTKVADFLDGPVEQYSVTFSVDLGRQQICLTPCKRVHGLTYVDPDTLKFEDVVNTDFPGPDMAGLLTISREDGHIIWVRSYYSLTGPDLTKEGWSFKGNCTKAAFTSFPSNSF